MATKFEELYKSHDNFFKFIGLLQSPFLLGIRLYWGYHFFRLGIGKFDNLPGTTGFFESSGIPMATLCAPLAAFIEYFGGLCLIFGLASRPAGLLLASTMGVALLTVHKMEMTLNQFYMAEPVTFFIASLTVLLFGPGKLSFDFLIGWAFSAFTAPPAPAKPGAKGGH
ncbi:MAG: DoxX family protein [Verrucomicrobiota bacterium]